MPVLRSAVAALRDVLSAVDAEEVAYRRRDGSEVRLAAVVGRTAFHSRGEYGTWTRVEARDFIVLAGALAEDPVQGDEIVFDGRVYEVLAPNGEPCWRWSDPFHVARRIHTKLTGERQ